MPQEQYANLIELAEYSFPVYASPGTETRAHAIAARAEQAYRFFQGVLNQHTKVQALILSPEDWGRFASHPMFGMPHYVDMHTLIVAGQEAEMWKMIVPPMEYLPPNVASALYKAYGQADSSVSIAPFMDLLALHEMVHLFINQAADAGDFHLPRRWLTELCCNLGLHAYVVNEEPAEMDHLTVFPQAIVALGNRHLSHTRLKDFEQLYAGMEPSNFAWYQSQLHVAAHHIYDAGGIPSLQAMFSYMVQSKENISDDQLEVKLQESVHPTVARVLSTWPELKLSEP